MPKVSVVMAVHNGMPYLNEAIQSILDQSLQEFELLIIDDASNDRSREVISGYEDVRIQLVENQSQRGLAQSLNIGIDRAQGEYIARMDHDDICFKNRLEKQATFLDQNADVAIVGTWAQTIGRDPQQIWQTPLENDAIRSDMIFNSPIIHSSVMLRKNTFDKLNLRYDPAIGKAQDYELWSRASQELVFANLPEILLAYRLHDRQVGQKFTDEQQRIADEVRVRNVKRLGVEPTPEEVELHNRAGRWAFPKTSDGLKQLEAWLFKLKEANAKSGYLPKQALDKTLEQRWWSACRSNVSLGLEAWTQYQSSPISVGSSRSKIQLATFWLKAILHSYGMRRG